MCIRKFKLPYVASITFLLNSAGLEQCLADSKSAVNIIHYYPY